MARAASVAAALSKIFRRVPTTLDVVAVLVPLLASSALAVAADRVDDIKSRGYLVCGLAPDHDGFALVHGQTSADGFDADFCRAIAAAIFGSPDHLRFIALATNKEFLDAADVDVVFHELTWTFDRELTSGLAFGPIHFFDGQAFLARDAGGVASAAEFPNASVCVEGGSGFVDNLIAFIQDRAPGMSIAVTGTRAEVEKAFFDGACDLLSGDASEIYSAARARQTGSYVVLADRFSEEPLAPVVRQGDGRLLAIVRWSIDATIEAEELGLTAANAGANDANWGALLDLPASAKLGLASDWVRNVIKAVGNYGEIYDRNLGPSGNVRMARGLNALWTQGGLLYSPPLR